MAAHHVVSGAITDTLLLMALGMLLTRTLGLAARAYALGTPQPAGVPGDSRHQAAELHIFEHIVGAMFL